MEGSADAQGGSAAATSESAAEQSTTAAAASFARAPELFAVSNDPLANMPTESHNKVRKPKRARSTEGDEAGAAAAGGNAAAGSSTGATAAARSGASLQDDAPPFKKRRLTPAEIAKLKADKAAAFQAKQRALVDKQEERRAKFSSLTEKTARGQPVLKNQMEHLLDKLQKQRAAETAAKVQAKAATAAKV